MEELQIFKNDEFGEIRTTVINGEPMFCLSDACRVLEIGNPSQAKTRLRKDGVITNEVIDSLGRTQTADFINESNLYKLIFQSRKPQAEKFSDWVTAEVLPSIRKHGAYMTEETLEKALTSPDFLIQLATKLKEEQKKNKVLKADNERMKPKEIFADAVSASNSTILIGELAKLLNQNGVKIGQNRLFAWMRENGFLIKRKGSDYNIPTQRAMDMGLFKIKESTVCHADGHVSITKTVKVLGKGQVFFVNKFKEMEEEKRNGKRINRIGDADADNTGTGGTN